jgi:hypothetical protein
MRGIATPGTIQLVPRAIKTPRGYKEHKVCFGISFPRFFFIYSSGTTP